MLPKWYFKNSSWAPENWKSLSSTASGELWTSELSESPCHIQSNYHHKSQYLQVVPFFNTIFNMIETFRIPLRGHGMPRDRRRFICFWIHFLNSTPRVQLPDQGKLHWIMPTCSLWWEQLPLAHHSWGFWNHLKLHEISKKLGQLIWWWTDGPPILLLIIIIIIIISIIILIILYLYIYIYISLWCFFPKRHYY